MTDETKNRKITASEATSKLIRTILKLPAAKIIALLNEVEEKQHLNKRETRIPYSAEVTFSVNEKFYSGYISNINSNGIFIETESRFKQGEKLTLSFEPPGNENHIKITGEIVRATEEGIGISFDVNIQALMELAPDRHTVLILNKSDEASGDSGDKSIIKFS